MHRHMPLSSTMIRAIAVLAMLAITPFEAVAPLPAAFERLGRSVGAADRLFEVIDAKPPTSPPEQPVPIPANRTLSVHGAMVVSASGDRILGPIDLTIPPGSRIGIVGETGAGKTLLLGALQLLTGEPARRDRPGVVAGLLSDR